MSYGEANKIANIIPLDPKVTLGDALKIPEMKRAMAVNPRVARLMKICGELGDIRVSTHQYAPFLAHSEYGRNWVLFCFVRVGVFME
jgi:hypothetical protein